MRSAAAIFIAAAFGTAAMAQSAEPPLAGAAAQSPPVTLPEPPPSVGADPLLDIDLPPIELGEPPVLPPVDPPDPELLVPLTALDSFDTDPRADFKFVLAAEDGLRYRLTVEGLTPTGLDAQFRRLSALHRGQNRPATAAQIASRTNADSALMEKLLFSEGWYGATVEQQIRVPEAPATPTANAQTVDVVLTAMPSDRYRWRQITLDLIPEELPQLKEGFGLNVGDPIRAIAVEEAEGALKLKLNRSGYPFVEIGVRDIVLDRDTPTGTYLLTGQIGPIGRFGKIRMGEFQPFDADHAAVIARFEEGELYNADLVDDFRRALIATQLFGGVSAVPVDSGERTADGEAITDIRIQGNAGPLRRLGGQIGYSSTEGFRAEGAWQHRNLWAPEGKFTGRIVLGTIEQRIAAEMVKSNFGRRDRSLTLLADVANLRRPAFRAETVTLGAELALNSTPIWQKPWTYSIGAILQASREESRATTEPVPVEPIDTEDRATFLIGMLPATVGRDSTDDLLDPQRGYRAAVTVIPEVSRRSGATDSYLRLEVEGSYYRQIRDNFVLAARVKAASILGSELDVIAPTRRLYAGGGGSVRGFEFQGIGPVGINGRPTGGRGLAEATLEGRYRFGNFGVVGFVDAGAINDDPMPSISGARFGIGVGARYYTGFGPLRVDVARAINKGPLDPVIGLYISIGQAF